MRGELKVPMKISSPAGIVLGSALFLSGCLSSADPVDVYIFYAGTSSSSLTRRVYRCASSSDCREAVLPERCDVLYVVGWNTEPSLAVRRANDYSVLRSGAQACIYLWDNNQPYSVVRSAVIPRLSQDLAGIIASVSPRVVVAHSSGAEALLLAAPLIQTDRPGSSSGPRVDQVVLCAPDNPIDGFRNRFRSSLAALGGRGTVITTRCDGALALARSISGTSRSGEGTAWDATSLHDRGFVVLDVSRRISGSDGHSSCDLEKNRDMGEVLYRTFAGEEVGGESLGSPQRVVEGNHTSCN